MYIRCIESKTSNYLQVTEKGDNFHNSTGESVFFFPLLLLSFFFFAIVAVPCVTMQGVAQGNKPVSQAGLMFNEDDSHWLLITAVSPNTDTFNTACHSRCSAQCQEDYQQPLTCTSAHTCTHIRMWLRP